MLQVLQVGETHERTEFLSKDGFEYLSKDRFIYLSNDRYITFLIKFIRFISIVNKTANCRNHGIYLGLFQKKRQFPFLIFFFTLNVF